MAQATIASFFQVDFPHCTFVSHLFLQLFGQFVWEYGRDAEKRTEADENVEEEGVGLPGRPQQERVQGALPRTNERTISHHLFCIRLNQFQSLFELY